MPPDNKSGFKDPFIIEVIVKISIGVAAFFFAIFIDSALTMGVGVNNAELPQTDDSVLVDNSVSITSPTKSTYSSSAPSITEQDSISNLKTEKSPNLTDFDSINDRNQSILEGVPLDSAVIDTAQVLTAEQRQILIARLERIHNEGLAQIAIVTVPSTQGIEIFDYAMSIAERWQLGSAKDDDGLLIVMAIEDRRMYIVTGYGLEGVLPDVVLKRYIDEDMTPLFKNQDYYGGLKQGLDQIEARLNSDIGIMTKVLETNAQRNKVVNDAATGNIVLGSFIIILAFGAFIRYMFGLHRKVTAIFFTTCYIGIAIWEGFGYISTLCYAVLLFILLWLKWIENNHKSGGNLGGGGGSNGNRRLFSGGAIGTGGSSSSGGYSGGGGSFGGGGAGGSW